MVVKCEYTSKWRSVYKEPGDITSMNRIESNLIEFRFFRIAKLYYMGDE